MLKSLAVSSVELAILCVVGLVQRCSKLRMAAWLL